MIAGGSVLISKEFNIMSFPVSPYDNIANVWKGVNDRLNSQLHEMLRDTVCRHESELVEGFCNSVLNNPASAVFLSQGRADVELKLHKWINNTFYVSLDKIISRLSIFSEVLVSYLPVLVLRYI